MNSIQPNILLIMSDEHAPMYSSTYGHPLVHTPSMDRLAAEGVTFDNAYCNSPLCLPSRMSFMTGRFIHRIGAYDNACPLGQDQMTWAHRLRAVGYDVVLSGKQHFCGLDQLHGFRDQLARDLHAEAWMTNGVPRGVPDWSKGTPPAAKPWAALANAGPGTTEEIKIDDLVEEKSLEYLRDPTRRQQPWMLCTSFIAPHFPFIVPQKFWDLYPPESIDLPEIPPGHLEHQHPVYQRMRRNFGNVEFPEEHVRLGRAGYYGLISYFDEKIGTLLQALDDTGQRDNTVVIHVSDHGEMNGEHGMWRKSNFYEASSRVPVQIRWPGSLPADHRVKEVISLVDVVATFVEIAGADPDNLDGESLLPLINDGGEWKNEAFCEYLAHGVAGPMAMLRRDQYKLNYSLGDPPELYNLETDPNEFVNLASDKNYHDLVNELQADLLSRWDPVVLDERVRRSQQERGFIERVHAQGPLFDLQEIGVGPSF